MNVIPVIASGALPVAAGVTALVRHRAWKATAREWRRAHPESVHGVIPGAESIALDGGERAALLVHGFGDTPQTLVHQARALHARGWTIRAPLLPGHGRTLEAFNASRAREWVATVQRAFEELCERHDHVAIVGLSMGGALATTLAAESGSRARALVLLAPFLEVSSRARWMTRLWPVWSLWRAWVCGDDAASIHDPVARRESLGYGCATPRLLRELRTVVDDAARISGTLPPTLVMHSRTDYRIPSALAERGYARLPAPVKALRWVENSGHVITVDADHAVVTQATIEWLERHVPAPTPKRPAAETSAADAPETAPPRR